MRGHTSFTTVNPNRGTLAAHVSLLARGERAVGTGEQVEGVAAAGQTRPRPVRSSPVEASRSAPASTDAITSLRVWRAPSVQLAAEQKTVQGMAMSCSAAWEPFDGWWRRTSVRSRAWWPSAPCSICRQRSRTRHRATSSADGRANRCGDDAPGALRDRALLVRVRVPLMRTRDRPASRARASSRTSDLRGSSSRPHAARPVRESHTTILMRRKRSLPPIKPRSSNLEKHLSEAMRSLGDVQGAERDAA